MSQPTNYTPTQLFPTVQNLDAELANIETTLDATLVNLKLIQRDDGQIRDVMVKLHTLAPDVLALMTASSDAVIRGDWLTATVYAVKDIVTESGKTYIAATAHTSGTFATDLAADKWVLLASPLSAADIPFTPGSGVAAATMQAAVEELGAQVGSVGGAMGFKNRLINGDGGINQRGNGTGIADDTYGGPDRFYVLTQTGTIAPSQIADPEAGALTGIRLTQSQAAAQRIGLAQIIESANIRDLRSAIATLASRVRLSTTSNVRYAVLEWIGAADAVTSDVVNDWTSSTYTAGNFFIAPSVNVLAVGVVAATAATARALTALNATHGASMQNVIVMVWTESTLAQNGTLDVWNLQYEPGSVATPYDRRAFQTVLALCQRYYERFDLVGASTYLVAGQAYAGTAGTFVLPFKVEKRVVPTAVDNSALGTWEITNGAATGIAATVLTFNSFSAMSKSAARLDISVAAGLTVGQVSIVRTSSTAFVAYGAEL